MIWKEKAKKKTQKNQVNNILMCSLAEHYRETEIQVHFKMYFKTQ
jgi:hypothetical protein